jgi:threonine-phosphate decarboxylase
MLLGHGDNAYQYNNKIRSNFSSNVYFKGPSTELIEHLKKHLHKIENYPQVAAENLSIRIAQKHGLKPENILVTNGATEAFYQIALLYKKHSSEIFIPSFAEYKDACNLHEHTTKFTNNKHLTENYKSNASVIWLCNPNNPDGKFLLKRELKKFVQQNRCSQIILDEAYTDFMLENHSLISEIQQLENLVIVRSLTKKYAIPGLRLGYIAAPKETIQKLMQLKEPWSVNSLAIEAGKFLLNEKKQSFDIKELINLSQNFQKELSKIAGVEVIPSKTSYFLVKLNKSATKTTEYLANQHGLLVRNASNFKGLDDSWIRISTLSEKQNLQLIKTLESWMNQ